ncbi:GFA family protein [Zoogloea sp.]|uniref:GFA family protein n=1 Tax=Zoogloea sp. TaxID=49181 RepID=UPI001A39A528|nr:GFA family protein [Zoogloeaceae bacterium]
MTDSDTPRLGGCQCGGVRYAFTGPVLRLIICYCRECQKQSASAFAISVFINRSQFRLTQGAPHWWCRPTDSGHTLECAFCPTCGSRLWHQRQGSTDALSIKGGSLDEPPDLTDAIHIWTSRKLPGLLLPTGSAQHLGQPVFE